MRIAAVALGLLRGTSAALATPIDWVNWTSATVGTSGVVSGTVLLGGSPVTVSYSGEVAFAQTSSGTNYWNPATPYVSATVPNAPPASDLIGLTGGKTVTNTITFGVPVINPVMAVVSLGQGGVPVRYVFNAPFELLSYGPGYWGSGTLAALPGNILEGREGHGTIQFRGQFTSISWTVPTYENWHGFTVGVPEPATLGLACLVLAVPGPSGRNRRPAE
jgi:hypothetical protein